LVVLIALIGSQLLNSFRAPEAETLDTGVFIAELEKGTVTKVTFNASTGAITGKYLKDGEKDIENATAFTSTYAGDGLNELMRKHPKTNYNIEVQNPNAWLTILSTLIPLLLIGGLVFFMFSQFNNANNKQMQFGKTKAKKAHEERPSTKFTDVAGIDEAVEELQEIKDFLVDPARYQKLGAKIPRGVLLVGPPGTGKTLLARAVAGEAGVPFFSISGSDFVEMFVGVGASRVRDLFEQAKTAAPSIIFIDEIDAVGRQRGAGLGGGHDEREQTLNQLLVEMDGFADHQSVILIAATNRVDILDPALLRPGRFDRQIMVMRPDLKGREEILRVHSEGKPLAHSVELERLAKMTPGFTGADLANLMNEAALLTARKNKKLITMAELEEAMEREIAGPERKSRVMTEKEKRTIAYHEAGHALVGHVLEHSDPVHKISIISRGQALGYTLSLPSEDRFLSSRNEMFDDLAVFLGGRVAEEIFCDDITTGASNDLERATKMARQMVTRYGMTEALGNQVYGEANHEVFLGRDYSATPDYSEATAERIDQEVAQIMTRAHDVARQTLTERTEQMELMVQILLDRETVEGEALAALLDNSWEDYLANEDDLLAKKAADLKQQEEDDERRAAAEEVKRSIQHTPVALVNGSAAPPPNSSMLLDEKTIADIYAGKLTLGDLVKQRLKGDQGGARPAGQDKGQEGVTDENAPSPDPSTLLDVPPAPGPDRRRKSSRTVRLEVAANTAPAEEAGTAPAEEAPAPAEDAPDVAGAAPETRGAAARPKKDGSEKPAAKHARTTARKPAKKQEDDSKKDA
jgi:cell division protease FtsH